MSPSSTDLERLRIRRDEESPKPGGTAPTPGRARKPIIGILIVLVLGTSGWVVFNRRPPEVTVAAAETTGGAGGGASASAITANGYVVARTKASVAAKLPGRLGYLGVSEGSQVKKGEIMARIENAEYRAALAAAVADEARAKAEVAQAQSDLARAVQLEGRGVISAVDLENARTKANALVAGYNAAVAQARLASANLENTNVRAPFDGTILRKDAEVGEIVAPSSAGGALTRTAIVTMADLTTLEVEVDVNEAYIARVTNGQPARITLDAYPDTSFAGEVRQVVPTADRQKATVLVKVAITDRDRRILPEMGARVDFVPKGVDAAQAAVPRRVYVPESALVKDASQTRVWIVAGGKVTSQVVTTGAADGARIEVKSGLAGDELVVVAPPAGLKEGARVTVRSS
jgi:RND family efflux transporter MFP subunit